MPKFDGNKDTWRCILKLLVRVGLVVLLIATWIFLFSKGYLHPTKYLVDNIQIEKPKGSVTQLVSIDSKIAEKSGCALYLGCSESFSINKNQSISFYFKNYFKGFNTTLVLKKSTSSQIENIIGINNDLCLLGDVRMDQDGYYIQEGTLDLNKYYFRISSNDKIMFDQIINDICKIPTDS